MAVSLVFKRFYSSLPRMLGIRISSCLWLALGILGLNAVLNEAVHYSRNDPDMYIHSDLLRNESVDIPLLLRKAKEHDLTARNLIEVKKIEIEAAKQKERQSFVTGVIYVVFPIICICCAMETFFRNRRF